VLIPNLINLAISISVFSWRKEWGCIFSKHSSAVWSY